jgi:hypothetical protein
MDALQARQVVIVSGYEWFDSPGGGWYIRARCPDPHFGLRDYDPMKDYPRLFRRFAEIHLPGSSVEDSKQRILDFANKYGLLRHPARLSPDIGGVWQFESFASQIIVTAEPLSDWLESAKDMDSACALWNAICARDEGVDNQEELREVLSRALECQPREDQLKVPLAAEDIQECLAHSDAEGLLFLAWASLQSIVNHYLRRNAQPVLLRPDRQAAKLHITSRGLLGSVWLQLAYEASGLNVSKQCKNPKCREFFPVGPTTRRSHAEYCSSSCRWQHYNKLHPNRSKRSKGMADDRAAGKGVQDHGR